MHVVNGMTDCDEYCYKRMPVCPQSVFIFSATEDLVSSQMTCYFISLIVRSP